MESEYLIFEKLKSYLEIEQCNDKNIRFYICQIIGRDTAGIGGSDANIVLGTYGMVGSEVQHNMCVFVEANFDIKFSDEFGFNIEILLLWFMYDCPRATIINILSEFNLFTEHLFCFKDEEYYWGSFFLPEVKKTFFSGIDSISQSNNLILMTNGNSKVLFDFEYDKSGMLVNKLFADLVENYEVDEDSWINEITLCENNQIVILLERMIDENESDFCYISIEYFNNEIKSFEEFGFTNPFDNQNLIPLDKSLAKKIEMLLKSNT